MGILFYLLTLLYGSYSMKLDKIPQVHNLNTDAVTQGDTYVEVNTDTSSETKLLVSEPDRRQRECNVPLEDITDCPPYEVGRSLTDDQIKEKTNWYLYNSVCTKEKSHDLDTVLAGGSGDCVFKDVYTRFFVHGYQPLGEWGVYEKHACAGLIDAYKDADVEKIGEDWQFVCIHWYQLAGTAVKDVWNEGVYDKNAKRCIDVGAYYGRKLIALADEFDLTGKDFQIVGHSLGSHFAGTMARTFNAESDKGLVAKVTGLDPAGPIFVFNGWGLKSHMIKSSDASFVQIIHTNGGLRPYAVSVDPMLGDLHQLGDVDIYVNGGKKQAGPCTKQGGRLTMCSHRIAIDFYTRSVNEKFPPAHECKNVQECSEHKLSGDATIQMGEWAEVENDGKLYHQNLDCWTKDSWLGLASITGYLGSKCCQGAYQLFKTGYYCTVDINS